MHAFKLLSLCFLMLFGACAGVSRATCPKPPQDAASVAEAPSDAAIIAQAHALLSAFDRADERTFLDGIEEPFALFEDQEEHDRAWLVALMDKRRTRGAPPVARSWGWETVRRSPAAAVYLAETTERTPEEPGRPARTFVGVNVLVFARTASGAAKAVHWSWTTGGIEGTRQKWNTTYREGTHVIEAPNQALVEAVRDVRPGTALDIGSGQGRNALFLASRGWDVTGVDISNVGHDIARANAAQRGLHLTLVEADTDHWDFGRSRWDLVTMIYMGSDEATVRRAQASLKPGGLFVLSGFAPEPGAPGPDSTGQRMLPSYFGPDFEVLRDERVDGRADWSGQESRLIHFVARKKR